MQTNGFKIENFIICTQITQRIDKKETIFSQTERQLINRSKY